MDISGKRSNLLDLHLHSNAVRGHITGTIVALSLHICNRNIIVLKELDDGISNLRTSDSVKTDEGQELLPNVIYLINEPGTMARCSMLWDVTSSARIVYHNVVKHNVFSHYFDELILGLRRHVGYITHRRRLQVLVKI